jgi:hypothetical protein
MNAQTIAALAKEECENQQFNWTGLSPLELVKAGRISPADAAKGIRNLYGSDASKAAKIMTPEQIAANDGRALVGALLALEAACIATLSA